MNNLLTVEEIKIALDKKIIELGYTSDGPVGFIVNGLILSDGFDVSDLNDALCIDAIWYAEDEFEEDDEFDEEEFEEECDTYLSVEKISEKYNNLELAKMIHESLETMSAGSDEITEYIKKILAE